MTIDSERGTLFLLPTHLGNTNIHETFPQTNSEIALHIHHYIVENIRTARRALKLLCPRISIDSCTFYELTRQTSAQETENMIAPLRAGHDMAIMSEAGMPCIADPGNVIVARAHALSIRVVPLIGPSSILLGLIASGFNGQLFTFHGYLPIKEGKKQKILKLESDAKKQNHTQIFMETPYRNQKLFEDLKTILADETKLCIACDITLPSQYIVSKTIKEWKKTHINLHKRLCVFLLQ